MSQGRKALIHRPDIKNPDHLDLLEPVARKVVRYRWGLETGEILTQEQTAEKLGTTREIVRRIEANAAARIIEHLESGPRVGINIIALIKRIEQIESTVEIAAAAIHEATRTMERMSLRIDELEDTINATRSKTAEPAKRRRFGRRT